MLIDKIKNELPIDSIEENENDIVFDLLNNNNVLNELFGYKVYDKLEGAYKDEASKKILSDVIEVFVHSATLYVFEYSGEFKKFVEDNF